MLDEFCTYLLHYFTLSYIHIQMHILKKHTFHVFQMDIDIVIKICIFDHFSLTRLLVDKHKFSEIFQIYLII